MKKRFLKKALYVALSLTLVGSAAALLPAVLPESSITANAASTYGEFKYEVSNNNDVTIVKYIGKSKNVEIPASEPQAQSS